MAERDENDLDSREIDRLAREAPKSDWQERSAPAAGDPMTDAELRGLSMLGQADHRADGPTTDAHAAAAGTGGLGDTLGDASAAGRRANPPLVEDAGLGDGGIAASGGAAGGA